jgi:hypothetical protein
LRADICLLHSFPLIPDKVYLIELLSVAIRGKGAFRRFKDVLLDYPEARERWFAFKNEQMRQRALSWLASEDIELDEK